jgi:hypothetical protein
MEKSSKRGKIPPQDWPSIINRYQSGETLASIARTYDCSPPAISYIVSRTRARDAAAEVQNPTPPQEPQLIKGHASAAPSDDPPPAEAAAPDSPAATAGSSGDAAPSVAEGPGGRTETAALPGELRLFPDETSAPPIVRREEPAVERARDPGLSGTAQRPPAAAAGPPPNGEPRRTLHLSLSGNDSHRPDPPPYAPPNTAGASAAERAAPAPAPMHPPAGQTARHGAGPHVPAANGAPPRPAPEPRSPREGGAFIDQALRERVDSDIAAFLEAFDAALDHDTAESRTGLREATDRLLRAGARTRIELERLEARVPLAPRDKGGQEMRAFRPR